MVPSSEQQNIINAPLAPLAVIACAGSGKTATAIKRLVTMRRLLGEDRGRVALLSFSNVAVDTFRKGYRELAHTLPLGGGRGRVDIDTLDGFITSHILRPHAYRTMGANQAAFLVMGSEPFLSGFNCATENFPIPITQLKVGIAGGVTTFYRDFQGNPETLGRQAADQVARLGRTGAYTHELGRYWCYRTLQAQPHLLRALVRRYPHVLVDEAQDIGSLHQAILELLIEAGMQVSLIGDPNQGIYEFAGANGAFLRNCHQSAGVAAFGLTTNYRSLPPILTLANRLSGRADDAHRAAQSERTGAYFVGYSEQDLVGLLDAFRSEVADLGMKLKDSAVLCRGVSLANQLAGLSEPAGQGLVKHFSEAAVLRDVHGRFLDAFSAVARGVINLLNAPPSGLLAQISNPAHDGAMRELKRCLWSFTRNAETGVPSSALAAASEWQPMLLARIRTLLKQIERDFGYAPVDNLGRRLARTGLPAAPLNAGLAISSTPPQRIRVDTVHQAKGESIDAVLYVAKRNHINAMLAGVQTELGRIGYVAATRARNLLWLGVPVNALRELRPALLKAGFQEVAKQPPQSAKMTKVLE